MHVGPRARREVNGGDPLDLLSSLSYLHSGRRPDTTYTYRIQACASLDGVPLCSPFSAALVTTTGQPKPPREPYDLTSSGDELCCGLHNVTSVRLDWKITGSDLPIAYWYIYLHGAPGNPTSAYDAGCGSCRVRVGGSTSAYTLTNLPAGSNATWAVQGVDSFGQISPVSSSASFTLAAPIVPGAPPRPTAGGAIGGLSPSRYLSIGWQRPSDGGLPITNYRVLINEGLGAQNGEATVPTGTAVRQFVRQPLPPSTNFSFRVAAYNGAGWGPYSEPFVAATAEPGAPTTPSNLRFGDLCCGFSNTTSLAVRWSVGSSDLAISHYLVTYNGSTLVRVSGQGHTLTNLYPGSTTEVSVVAVNAMGMQSAASPPVNFTIAPPRVPGVPTELRQLPPVSGLSPATTLATSWRPARGYGLPIERYDLFVTTLDRSGAPAASHNFSIAGWRSAYSLLRRRPVTNYTLALRAVNALGAGEMSETLLLSTSEGSVPERPQMPQRGGGISGISDVSTFFITWRPPESPAYAILSFKVEVFSLANASSTVDLLAAPLTSATLGFKTTFLYRCGENIDIEADKRCEPQSTYAFRVAARNALGWSEWSDAVTLTSAPMRAPQAPLPPKNEMSSNYWLSRGWILAYWKSPYDEGMPVTKYELRVTNLMDDGKPAWNQDSFQNRRCATSDCTTVVNALTMNIPVFNPSDNRTVYVRAYNGLWGNWSAGGVLISQGPLAPRKMAPVRNSWKFRSHGHNNCTSITFSWTEASSASQSLLSYETRIDYDDSTIKEYPTHSRIGYYAVEPGSTHFLQVRAWNSFRGEPFNHSEWSTATEITSQTEGLPFKPDPVRRVEIPGMENTTSISVIWYSTDTCNSVREVALEVDHSPSPFITYKSSTCQSFFPVAPFLPGTPHVFRVRGKNRLGWGNWSDPATFWTESTVPARPLEQPVILNLNASTVELSMQHPYNNGLPLIGLSVQSLNADQVVEDTFVPITQAEASSGSSTVALDRLGANASVGFRYAGVNAKGTGEYSSAVLAGVEITFEPEAPGAASVVDLAARSANLTFSKPTRANNPGAHGHPIVITRIDVQVEATNQPLIVHQLTDSQLAAQCVSNTPDGPCTFDLQGLVPAMEYSVRLVAWTVDGASPTSLPLTFETPADVPAPVTAISPTVLGSGPADTSDSIVLAWTPPTSDNGRPLTRFVVHACVWPEGVACVSQSLASSSAVQATISGLTPGVNYTLAVEAFNEMGSSGNATAPAPPYTTYSVPQQPALPVLGPPLPGLPLTTTIHAVWSPPFANGLPLERYNLLVDGAPLTMLATLGYPQQVYVGLLPGTPHNLSVQAVNSKGAGPFSDVAVFRTDDAPPGKPTSISAEGLGDGSTMLVRVGEAAYSGGVPVRFVELEWRTARAASVWEPVPSVGNHSVSPSTFFPLTFHVARPRLDLEYHFRARAVNALGASEWSEDVRVLSTNALRPPMPVNFTTIAGTATSSSATFSWNMPPGLNGSLHGITYYSLELVPTSAHATAIEAVVTSSNLIGADLECETVCSVIVSGLVPAATYIATVSAVNGGGGGLSLGSLPTPGINMTTAASIPAAVATLSVATAYANVGPVLPLDTTVTFSFGAPYDNGAAITNYVLELTDVQSGVAASHNVPPAQTTYAVTGLPAGRNFTATILAVNAIGSGTSTALTAVSPPQASYTAGHFTTPSVPITSYPVFRASPALDGLDITRTIHVMWTPPFDNGVPITTYNLSVDGAAYVPLPAAPTPQYVLGGLIPGTAHTFQVQAANPMGTGPWSALETFSTTASVPGAPTKAPRVTPNGTSLMVTWPEAAYTGGDPILRYEIWCSAGGGVANCNGTTALPGGSETRSHVVHDYQRQFTYTFRARAVNIHGAGAWSAEEDFSSAVAGQPPSPYLALLGSPTPRAANITFRMPTSSGSLGVTRYEATVFDVATDERFGPIREIGQGLADLRCVADCHATLDGLKPDTAYRVEITSYVGALASIASVPVTFSTPPTVPDAVDVSLVSLAASNSTWLTLLWPEPPANSDADPVLDVTASACPCTATTLVLESSSKYTRRCTTAPSLTSGCTPFTIPVSSSGRRLQPVVAASSMVTSTLSELQPGTDYVVFFEARSALGVGPLSSSWPLWFTTLDVPTAGISPVRMSPALAGVDLKTSIHVVWLSPFNNGLSISSYDLEHCVVARATCLSFSVPSPLNDSLAAPQYLAESLQPGTQHTFKVRAKNAMGFGPWSPPSSFETEPDVPGPPAEPSLLSQSATSLSVALNPAAYAGGSPVTTYEVEWCENTGSGCWVAHASASPVGSANLSATGSLQYDLPQTRVAGYDYQFRARARNALGVSQWSSTLLVLPSDGSDNRPHVVRDVTFGYVLNSSSGNSSSSHCYATQWTASPSAALATPSMEFEYRVGVTCTYAAPPNGMLNVPARWRSMAVPGFTCAGGSCFACVDGLLPGGHVSCQSSVIVQNRFGSAATQTAATTLTFERVPEVPVGFTSVVPSENSLAATWTAPTSYAAPIIAYRVRVQAIGGEDGADGVSAVREVETSDSTLLVDGLAPGTTYSVSVQAHNRFGWSAFSPFEQAHTHARPDRPRSVGYMPDVPHEDKIHAVNLTWSLPESHGLPLLGQELAVGNGSYALRPEQTQFAIDGFAPNTRIRAKVRMRNALGWSEWSAEAYLITDPDVPAADDAPMCADLESHAEALALTGEDSVRVLDAPGASNSTASAGAASNGTLRDGDADASELNGAAAWNSLVFELPLARDNGEPVDRRRVRVYHLGNASSWGGDPLDPFASFAASVGGGGGGGGGGGSSPAGNATATAAAMLLSEGSTAAMGSLMLTLNVSAAKPMLLLEELPPSQCYRTQLSSHNELGWGEWSAPSPICCTAPLPSLLDNADMALVATVSLVSGTSCMAGLLVLLVCCAWFKFTKLFGDLNATLYGKKNGLAKWDGSRVEKYMDHNYTAGLDDADDVSVNPVLLHKIKMEKEAALRKKRAKIADGGGGSASGGLKRLGFSMDDVTPKNGPHGKRRSLVDVERYLAGQGTNMEESKAAKQTVAGKKVNDLMAATKAGSSDHVGHGAARAAARRACGGSHNRLVEDDGDDVVVAEDMHRAVL